MKNMSGYKIVSLEKINSLLNQSHPSITLRSIGITGEQIEDKLKTFKL